MNNKRILIVDDTPSNIRVLKNILRDQYLINVAISGPEALKLAASDNRPDLILLDIMMPGMDGYEVIKRLKSYSATKEIPVLFVTAKGEEKDEAFGLSLGAVDYITKPVSPAIVKARVDNHMRLHLYQKNLEEVVMERTKQLKEGYVDTLHRLTLASELLFQ